MRENVSRADEINKADEHAAYEAQDQGTFLEKDLDKTKERMAMAAATHPQADNDPSEYANYMLNRPQDSSEKEYAHEHPKDYTPVSHSTQPVHKESAEVKPKEDKSKEDKPKETKTDKPKDAKDTKDSKTHPDHHEHHHHCEGHHPHNEQTHVHKI